MKKRGLMQQVANGRFNVATQQFELTFKTTEGNFDMAINLDAMEELIPYLCGIACSIPRQASLRQGNQGFARRLPVTEISASKVPVAETGCIGLQCGPLNFAVPLPMSIAEQVLREVEALSRG